MECFEKVDSSAKAVSRLCVTNLSCQPSDASETTIMRYHAYILPTRDLPGIRSIPCLVVLPLWPLANLISRRTSGIFLLIPSLRALTQPMADTLSPEQCVNNKNFPPTDLFFLF